MRGRGAPFHRISYRRGGSRRITNEGKHEVIEQAPIRIAIAKVKTWWPFPVVEETLVNVRCAGGDDGQERIAVNLMHVLKLVSPVLVPIVDDAQSIHPEELESQRVCDPDCIPDGLGQKGGLDFLFILSNVDCSGFVRLILSAPPDVTECEVTAALAGKRCNQPWLRGVVAVNESRGEERVGEGRK